MYFSQIIDSPIGELVAIASEKHLLILEFADSPQLAKKWEQFDIVIPAHKTSTCHCEPKAWQSSVCEISGSPHFAPLIRDDQMSQILTQTRTELSEYFAGTRKSFTIPLSPDGTDFQKSAWQALGKIPYGETRSYLEEAHLAWSPKAVRAIGGANNKNPIVIIIPCHRVIGANGKIIGYGGGIERKVWLLQHEQQYS